MILIITNINSLKKRQKLKPQVNICVRPTNLLSRSDTVYTHLYFNFILPWKKGYGFQ